MYVCDISISQTFVHVIQYSSQINTLNNVPFFVVGF